MALMLAQDWCGWVWPSGHFGLSKNRFVRVKGFGSKYRDPNPVGLLGFHPAVTAESAADYQKLLDNPSSLMGSSNVSKSHRGHHQRGRKGLTSYGRRVVESACSVLEAEAGAARCTFFTGTVPELGSDRWGDLVSSWPDIIRVFNQRLGRHLQRAGLSGEVIGVTELQMKRYKTRGGCPYHYHCFFEGWSDCRGFWAVTPSIAAEIWRDSVEGHIGPVNWLGAESRIESVRKSVGGYMAKYLSKGGDVPDGLPCPPSWYSCTRSLLRRVRSLRLRLRGESAAAMLDLIRRQWDGLVYARSVLVEGHCGEFEVGVCGRVASSRLRWLESFVARCNGS